MPGRGFTFPDDAAVQYTFRTLHQIIGCMESGALLVLLDLRRLYGTLYDARAPATPVWGQGMKGGLRHTLSSAIPFGCVPLVSGHTSIDNAIYLICNILVSGLDPPHPPSAAAKDLLDARCHAEPELHGHRQAEELPRGPRYCPPALCRHLFPFSLFFLTFNENFNRRAAFLVCFRALSTRFPHPSLQGECIFHRYFFALRGRYQLPLVGFV